MVIKKVNIGPEWTYYDPWGLVSGPKGDKIGYICSVLVLRELIDVFAFKVYLRLPIKW